MLQNWRRALCVSLAATVLLSASATSALAQATIRGTVSDQLGAPVKDAKVTLQKGDMTIGSTTTGTDGSYTINPPESDRYRVQVEAAGFAAFSGQDVFVSSNGTATADVSLRVGTIQQELVVSATGTAIPVAQVGASVTLIGPEDIQAQNKLDALENLRQVPGAQIVQTAQRGGNTSLFIRGGDSSFNKVMIDGAPANAIGGGYDYAQLSNAGIQSMEVLRGPNSVLYGSDALAGVVNFTTRRGTSELPELTLSGDAGNFGTHNESAGLAGAYKRFDYFSQFTRFDTRGSVPNSYFHNATYAGNFGYRLNTNTDLRVTYRRNWTDLGSPNGLLFYGIADDSLSKNQNTYLTGTASNQTTSRWHNLARFAFSQFGSSFTNPSMSGIPIFGNGFGKVMTIVGANGYSVTGQGILDYGGTFPQRYPNYAARRSFYGQTDYRVFGDWTATYAFRYEHENGSELTRDNYTNSLETHGSIGRRLYVTLGVGLEKNAVFGFAATPRVSAAYYLRQPASSGFFSETKLRFNFGKGIKEPSTGQQGSQLYALLTPEQRTQFNVSAVGPERSRAFDFGIDQGFWSGRARLELTYFNNRYYDIISYLDVTQLITIGVPPAAAQATGFGAYVNASSNKSQGFEAQVTTNLGHGLRATGSYTYLDAVATKTFGDPVFNPLFPGVPIGGYSALVGARPFRRAPHTGSMSLVYANRKFTGSFTGYMVSRRDDSTYLVFADANFDNTMLLPNRNVAQAYQKFDISGRYQLKHYVAVYTTIENLFSQHYSAALGFPALPFSFRSGLTFTIGGESWR